MSWRLIFVVLIAAASISAWLGLRLGDWLVAHGPLINTEIQANDSAATPVLDADGRPYTAQPPQPLINGRLAVPEPAQPITWEIQPEGLNHTLNNPLIATATTSISMYQAQQLANQSEGGLSGIADVGDLLGVQSDGKLPLQPIEAPGVNPAQQSQGAASGAGGASQAWQADLRRALNACQTSSFFDRPSCLWAARNQYCGANNAWGQIDDCPARNF